jgi:hypothetical protein
MSNFREAIPLMIEIVTVNGKSSVQTCLEKV